MAVLYKSVVTCGTLSVLLLNDRGINLYQFLFTLKRVLMKQIQIQQKEVGGVCVYTRSSLKVKRLTEMSVTFETGFQQL